MLLVSRGSGESSEVNILSSGLGQIKAFDLSDAQSQPYDFDTSGRLLGWGLFNAVGLGEHPATGGIFSTDNGADDITRDGVDVHQTDPGDEMNFHGFLNGTTAISSSQEQGSNYGYPDCYAAWNTSIPDAPADLKVGEQFSAVDNGMLNDTACRTEYVAPRLTFLPHQAPLDIVFAPDGTAAYITFHGSSKDPPSPPSPRVFLWEPELTSHPTLQPTRRTQWAISSARCYLTPPLACPPRRLTAPRHLSISYATPTTAAVPRRVCVLWAWPSTGRDDYSSRLTPPGRFMCLWSLHLLRALVPER